MGFEAMAYLQYFGFERIKDHNELNVMASCPNEEMHTNGDAKRSFGMRKDTGVANCYVCGGWNLEQLTAEMLNKNSKDGTHYNEYDAIKFLELKQWLPDEENIQEVTARFQKMTDFEREVMEAPKKKVFQMEELEQYTKSLHKKALQRGTTLNAIDIATARKFKLGYDKQTRRIIIPVFSEYMEFVGVTSRATMEDDFIRYGIGTVNPEYYQSQINNTRFEGEKMLYTFDKRHYVYGEHTWYNVTDEGARYLKHDTILVIESPLDMVYAYSQGLHEFMNIGAIFGSKCTREQLTKILRHKYVVEGLDNDNPGKEGREKFYKDVMGRCKLHTFDSYDKKDLGDCTPEEVQGCASRFVPYSQGIFSNLQPMID
jgi:hypothetical protein